jgi:hypothetical protein
MRRFSILWLLLIVVSLSSVGFAIQRLGGMPQLPVTIGPDMRVREVKMSEAPAGSVIALKRGDRLVALDGRSTEDLRDLRQTLRLIDTGAEKGGASADGSNATSPSVEPIVGPVVNYQLVRPLHRFDLLLQGEPLDPTALPPGVHEGDKLVELDGRPMKPKVGTEGLRSIISSRPEALLVLEREQAVFDGELVLGKETMPWGVVVCFGIAILLMLAVWRFHHATLSRWTALAIAAETVAFAWWSLLVFEYQWAIADYALAYGAIIALVLTRSLGIFARTASAEDGGANKWGALALGVVGAVFVAGTLAAGKLPNAEVALQFAAVLAGLFVIFEIVLTGLNEGSGTLLGERSVYLAGILLFVILACVVSYSIEPVAFREERWRWFAAIVLAMVWFGDILLCFRGLPATPFAEIASRQARRERLVYFLEEVAQLYPQVRPVLAVSHEESVFVFDPEKDIIFDRAEEPLSDAIAILLQERARVPASLDVPEQTDPMAGIAKTMGIGLAMQMLRPVHGMEIEDAAIVLLGYQRDGMPPVPVQELDFAQHRMSVTVWGAAMVELTMLALNKMPTLLAEVRQQARDEEAARVAAQPAPSEQLQRASSELEQTREALTELEQESKMLRKDRLELATQVASLTRWLQPAPALPPNFEELLEKELLDSLEQLFDSAAPIVFTGPKAAGKTFTSSAGHWLEGRAPSPCVLYDAALFAPEDHGPNLLGHARVLPEEESDAPPSDEPVVFEACRQGTLIIQRAEWLPPELFDELIEQAEAYDVRLYICFDVRDLQGGSPLAATSEEAREILEPRELLIPGFEHRHAVKEIIIGHWLQEISWFAQRDVVDLSPAAFKAMLGYDWPGNLDELILTMERAVRHGQGDFIELGDLPLDVRRGTF